MLVTPIVSAIALGAQLIFHKEITADIQETIVTTVVNLIFIYHVIVGIFSNPVSQLPVKEKVNALELTPIQNSDNLQTPDPTVKADIPQLP